MGRRHQPRKKTKLDKLQCILLVVFGLLVGTVFTVGMGYWNAAVTPEEAVPVTAIYASHEVDYGGNIRRRAMHSNSINQVFLYFADHERLAIDGSCAYSDVLDALEALPSGTTLDMLVHPNIDTVLSIAADGETILAFEDTTKSLSIERWGVFGIGVFCYIGAGVGAYYLITKKYRKYY